MWIRLLVDVVRSRQIAAALGTLAGLMLSDKLRSLEIGLGSQALPDVVVWAVLET